MISIGWQICILLCAVTLVVLLCLWGQGVIGNNHNDTNRTEVTGEDHDEHEEDLQNPTRKFLNASAKFNQDMAKGQIQITEKQFEYYEKLKNTIAEYNQNHQRVTKVDLGISNAAPTLINNIMYINMTRNPERNRDMHQELTKQQFPPTTQILRFEGVAVPGNGAKGCYLSHLHCLAWAAANCPGQNVLILEDDFVFTQDRDTLESEVRKADRLCKGRWDVIVLGQYVHEWQPLGEDVFRLLNSTTTSGYLVHQNYVKDLFMKWHLGYLVCQDHPRFVHEDNLDQKQIQFQKRDIWLGFKKALGAQRAGISTIGNNQIENTWRCNDRYNMWYDNTGTPHPLKLGAPLLMKKVALCLVATGKYHKFVPYVTESCVLRFVKPHELEFFVFTDQLDHIPDDYHGCRVNKYYVQQKGFPGDTLYRYHYILTAEERLKHMHHIFYMDVDYWVCNSTDNDRLLSDGLVGTMHLHNLVGNHAKKPGRKGAAETNPKSTAFIEENANMQYYFCGGFQGGTADRFLEACKTMKQNIDTDDANGVMATWHDESHWNRYLVDHPPQIIMNQSYVYPEECLSPKCNLENCVNLRKYGISPVMVALAKNHKEVRG
jgi:histo-blood group ABO system transferase